MMRLEAEPFGRKLTDPAQRADIARWAVSLRRAHAAGTEQVTGQLARFADHDSGYCCLGVWCEVAEAMGRLSSDREEPSRPVWGSAVTGTMEAMTLPHGAFLNDDSNPQLLGYFTREAEDYYDETATEPETEEDRQDLIEGLRDGGLWSKRCAAELNDADGLTFAQIADVVVWSYGLTPEELAEAEAAPRVPVVEGPA
jgi:hypothetical protein